MTRLGAIRSLKLFVTAAALVALPSYAQALEVPSQLDGWAITFYTFGFSSVFFYSATMLSLREFGWLSYAGYALLLLFLNAALDGSLAYVVGGDALWMTIAPLFIGAVTVGYGFVHVAYRMESPHWLSRMRGYFYGLAVLALTLLPAYFLVDSVVPLYATLNTLMLLMFVAQAFPPITWSDLNLAQHRAAFIAPLLLAFLVVGFYSLHFLGGGFSLEVRENANRLGLLIHLGQLLVFVVIQLAVQFKTQRQAEQAAIEAARLAAENALALERSEKQFARARDAAGEWSRQLATASHDIKQPIAALRAALMSINDDDRREDTTRIRDAVDYLDQLASSYLHLGADAIDEHDGLTFDASDPESSRQVSGREDVSTAMLLDTVAQMYELDAQAANIQLTIRRRDCIVSVQPLAVIRILSNLLSNAIVHSGASRILVGVRRHGANVRIEVYDNGMGMSPETLSEAMELRARGDHSTGTGLGLAIVVALAEEHDLRFELSSQQDSGTKGTLEIPNSTLE